MPLGGEGDIGVAAGLRCIDSGGDFGLLRGVAGGAGGLVSVGVPMGTEPAGEPGEMPKE